MIIFNIIAMLFKAVGFVVLIALVKELGNAIEYAVGDKEYVEEDYSNIRY